MLDTSRDQLRRGFKQLCSAQRTLTSTTGTTPKPALLIKFYAAEVGMKFRWLEMSNRHRSSQILDDRGNSYGHNLERLAAAILLPRQTVTMPTALHANQSGTVAAVVLPVTDSHQAWRYGRDLDGNDELAIAAWLDAVIAYLESLIGA